VRGFLPARIELEVTPEGHFCQLFVCRVKVQTSPVFMHAQEAAAWGCMRVRELGLSMASWRGNPGFEAVCTQMAFLDAQRAVGDA
jgi:hypothetical protein